MLQGNVQVSPRRINKKRKLSVSTPADVHNARAVCGLEQGGDAERGHDPRGANIQRNCDSAQLKEKEEAVLFLECMGKAAEAV